MEQITAEKLSKVNESAKELFGADINIAIARCPAWGCEDTCIVISGKRHLEAASGFARQRGATLSTKASGGFMSIPAYTYSEVTLPAGVAA